MKSLQYLQSLTDDDYENERRRIIDEAINLTPSEHRQKISEMQLALEEFHESNPSLFLNNLFSMICENAENISDQLMCLMNTLHKK